MSRQIEENNSEMIASFIEETESMRTPLLYSPEEHEIKTNRNNEHNSYYPKFLTLIGLFYILPSLQFVFFQSQDNGIFCYYNYKCLHNLDFIPAFNAIISNALYILYGIIFLIVVKINDRYYNIEGTHLALKKTPYLYYSLGISLIFEGICSATYHICPTKLNFQFDTTFMFIGGILMYITIYSKRHEEPDPMKIYSFLCFLIFVNILPLAGLTTDFEQYFWGAVFIVLAYIMINVSVHIYYGQSYDFDIDGIKRAIKNFKKLKKREIPKLALLVVINLFTLGMYVWAVVTQLAFTDWILGIIIVNMLIYFCYYLIQKLRYREKISKIYWTWMAIDLAIFILSLIFFAKTSSNIFLTPEESNHLNAPCVVLEYFDYHDIWHILSATGLFIFMNIVFFLDRQIDSLIGQEIKVF
tara:strand:- start:3 stop:1241 length:1239 start_codon:yes stop_codon:yes gene_type:complete